MHGREIGAIQRSNFFKRGHGGISNHGGLIAKRGHQYLNCLEHASFQKKIEGKKDQ